MKKSGLWLAVWAGVMLASCRMVEAEGHEEERELLATEELVLYALDELEQAADTSSVPYISTGADSKRLAERLATYRYKPVTDRPELAGIYGIATPSAGHPGRSKHSLLVIQPEGSFTHYDYETSENEGFGEWNFNRHYLDEGGNWRQMGGPALTINGVRMSSGFLAAKEGDSGQEEGVYHLLNVDSGIFHPRFNAEGAYTFDTEAMLPARRNADNTIGSPLLFEGTIVTGDQGLSFLDNASRTRGMARFYGNEADVLFSVFKETGLLSTNQLTDRLETLQGIEAEVLQADGTTYQ